MRAIKFYSVGLFLCLFSASVFAGGKHLVTYISKDDFDTVKNAITEAIAGKGLVINTTSHIGEMLERTGKDMGGAKQVFVKAESIEFCSASVSRKTMEADPHNIVFCPYIISVYVLPKEPKKTYVSYRKPDLVGTAASKASLKAVDKLLHEIIDEALN